jgi:hypothetical protein
MREAEMWMEGMTIFAGALGAGVVVAGVVPAGTVAAGGRAVTVAAVVAVPEPEEQLASAARVAGTSRRTAVARRAAGLAGDTAGSGTVG